MYIAFIRQIDNLTIITGICRQVIDPVATEKIIDPLLAESHEMKADKPRIEKIRTYNKNVNNAEKKAMQLFGNISAIKNKPFNTITIDDFDFNQKDQLSRYNNSRDLALSQVKELQKDLPTLNKKLIEKRLELLESNAVYFELGANQVELSKSQAEEFNLKLLEYQHCFESTKIKKLLLLSGEEVIDYRGKKFYQKSDKWYSKTIEFLTDEIEVDEICEDYLDDDQKKEIAKQLEDERLSGLSQQEKQQE